MASFYDVVHRRRDVRGEFTGGVVPTDVLCRILTAAHSAPSVGLSQPWDFILVRDMDTRTAFRDHVQAQREIFANQLDEAQAKTFARIKVEGVLESSLGIVVTYDPQRGGPA
ncbi:MAG: nitroreductase family protein, partial [Pseudonocardiaceae bacterium]